MTKTPTMGELHGFSTLVTSGTMVNGSFVWNFEFGALGFVWNLDFDVWNFL